MTREQYLNKMTIELNDRVFKQHGYELNIPKIKISCRYPSKNGTARKSKTLGECYHDSLNGYNEIFINPCLADSVAVGDTLAHELIHAYDNCINGHKKPFRDIAKKIGLEGKMTSTHAGEKLTETLQEIVKDIGEYPHEELKFENKKKQTTRMIKVYCPLCELEGSKNIARTSRINIDENNKPRHLICRHHGDTMIASV